MRILIYEGTSAELSEYFKAQLADTCDTCDECEDCDDCDDCDAPLGEDIIAAVVRAVLEQLPKQK